METISTLTHSLSLCGIIHIHIYFIIFNYYFCIYAMGLGYWNLDKVDAWNANQITVSLILVDNTTLHEIVAPIHVSLSFHCWAHSIHFCMKNSKFRDYVLTWWLLIVSQVWYTYLCGVLNSTHLPHTLGNVIGAGRSNLSHYTHVHTYTSVCMYVCIPNPHSRSLTHERQRVLLDFPLSVWHEHIFHIHKCLHIHLYLRFYAYALAWAIIWV